MARTSVAREVLIIRRSFAQLAASFARLGPALAKREVEVAASGKASTNSATSIRRRPKLTARQRAALKLQGKYMGTMRGLKPRQRAKVKRVRAAKGIREAIRAAERMVG